MKKKNIKKAFVIVAIMALIISALAPLLSVFG